MGCAILALELVPSWAAAAPFFIVNGAEIVFASGVAGTSDPATAVKSAGPSSCARRAVRSRRRIDAMASKHQSDESQRCGVTCSDRLAHGLRPLSRDPDQHIRYGRETD